MQSTRDLKPLTSLRFVAASMIVLLHAWLYFPWADFVGGIPLHQGVSFFFVLSGFILTHVYSQKKTAYWSFMLARFARLWPVHLVTCLMVVAFIRPDSQQFPGSGFFNPWVVLVSNLTLTHALVPFVNYTFSWNSVSWSISTEVFFYLAFPALLVGLARSWHWKLTAAVGIIGLYSIAISVLGLPAEAPVPEALGVAFLTYASPLFRGFEFVLGMTAYIGWKRLDRMGGGLVAGTVIELAAIGVCLLWVTGGIYWAAVWFSHSAGTNAWYSSSMHRLRDRHHLLRQWSGDLRARDLVAAARLARGNQLRALHGPSDHDEVVIPPQRGGKDGGCRPGSRPRRMPRCGGDPASPRGVAGTQGHFGIQAAGVAVAACSGAGS
jgi:peptidoglycan/LPS O-acetylase OafA/YrhL